jgi:hypothetical protein
MNGWNRLFVVIAVCWAIVQRRFVAKAEWTKGEAISRRFDLNPIYFFPHFVSRTLPIVPPKIFSPSTGLPPEDDFGI